MGETGPDSSAIQVCIQRRLQAAADDEVRSVFDLASIVVDQYCRDFFDRMRPVDLQPLIFDWFVNLIIVATDKQARAC